MACSIYIHIPFCLQKCRYCDFLSGPRSGSVREEYVQTLIREIRDAGRPEALSTETPRTGSSQTKSQSTEFLQVKSLQDESPLAKSLQDEYPLAKSLQDKSPLAASLPGGLFESVDTVFLGGGTPSVMTADQIHRIMGALRETFRIREDAEISMEMNPGTADAEKLRSFRRAGINRLSIGVQSLQDHELRLLGRIHTAEEAAAAFRMARETGFDNINIDLMSALPGQTFETWADTLEEAVRWQPEHISAYSLIIEPGTPFADMLEKGTLPPLPDEETDREMYRYTRAFLQEHGYRRYEISNYAKPGRECRHNTGYWTGHPYLGFGIGAASYTGNVRYSNISSLEDYLALKIRTDLQVLTEEEKIEEFMFLGLRMTDGVRDADFSARFGRDMDSVYGPVIKKHIAQGLLEQTGEGVRLTERGIDISNYVLADYLL